MGNYNPHAAIILGEEWVPIRDENVAFSPAVNSVELGHGFTLATARQVSNAHFYINELKPLSDRGQTFMAAVYPAGLEDQSGPISSLLVPCNAATLTSATTSGAATAVEALATQSTSSGISLDCSQPNTGLALNFALTGGAAILAGKRILGVNLLTGTAASSDITGPLRTTSTSVIKVSTTATIGSTADPEALFGRLRIDQDIDRTPFGEINQFWAANSPNVIADRVPWTYGQLQRLDNTATKLYVRIETGTNRGTTANSTCYIFYAAIEVIYCEEKRLIVGATQFGTSNASHSFGAESVLGANQIIMHDIATSALNPILATGNYVVALSSADVGGLNDNQAQLTSDYPNLNAIRELYAIQPHPGIQVNLPFPLIDHIGEVFTSDYTHILPQLSLHASGGTLTEPHVYGRQAAAQVYGANTATQRIYDTYGAAASYPQARYYARRFGDTVVPLTFAGCDTAGGMALPGVSGSYASTPDNAALDIVGDIDLRIDATLPDWSTPSGPTFISKWTNTGPIFSYLFGITSAGILALGWSADGINGLFALSTAAVVPDSCGRLAIRVTLDVDNGAAGRTITFYTAPTMAGPFVQLGAQVVQGGVTSIFSSTAPVEIGSHTGGTNNNLAGVVHSAQILNGIAGVAAANPDFSAQALGTTSFADAAGRTWTLNGLARIVSAGSSFTTSITPADFDELVEIIDGWKEITFRFSGAAPVMGVGANPAYTWSAVGETGGNRWEVLAASAPALSGIGSNLFNQVPTADRLGTATYQPPSGDSIDLVWMPQGVASPWVTSPSEDPATDAVLIFSQDPATITGVSLTARTQVVTGIGLDCGTLPCCIPTGISYNQVGWGLPGGTTTIALDTFSRVVVSGWGSADTGQAYALSSFAAIYGVNGSIGTITPNAANVDNHATLSGIGTNVDITAQVGLQNAAIATSIAAGGLSGRWADVQNHYLASWVTTASTGATTLQISKRVLNVSTVIAGAVTLPFSVNAGAMPWIRFMIDGSYLKAKIWVGALEDEPLPWNLEITDTSLTAGTSIGAYARTDVAIGNIFTFDNLTAGPPRWQFGSYELQRWDSLVDDFQTIMLATDPGLTVFNDYEARVGITSVYRVRALNSLNFAGAWSTYVSGAPPAPGVTGGCSSGATGALIFTSNADQAGLNNAAYVMQWENTPTEDFQLPEGDMVTYQPVYGRDGSIAFHGTERGLETFDRTVLLHAAAIDPIRLADARTIRDLAWANLPYVCVRDELGDRWFASVRVPSVNARLNRTKYMARIEVVETTQTPYPVDP